jgi:hypothetical protein
MARFTDCLGREWTLRVTLGHRAGLKALGVDAANLGTALGTLTELTAMDADRLVAVCHLLTVDAPPLVEYEAGFDADTIGAAGEALADAVADFYLSRRPKMAAAVKARVREAMAELDAKAAEGLTRSGTGTNSPDSAASTPAPTP